MQLSIMYKRGKIKSKDKQPTEICRLSEYLSEFYFILKLTNLMLYITILGPTMNTRCCQLLVMKFWELLWPNSQQANFFLRETKYLKGLNLFSLKEQHTLILWLIIWLLPIWLSWKNIWKQFRQSKWLNKRQKEQNTRWSKPNKQRRVQLFKLKLLLNRLNWLVWLPKKTHVNEYHM